MHHVYSVKKTSHRPLKSSSSSSLHHFELINPNVIFFINDSWRSSKSFINIWHDSSENQPLHAAYISCIFIASCSALATSVATELTRAAYTLNQSDPWKRKARRPGNVQHVRISRMSTISFCMNFFLARTRRMNPRKTGEHRKRTDKMSRGT